MKPNTHHPGRPNYTGPDSGVAGYVHHNVPVEYCWSFKERLAVIDADKPERERAVRRHCLTYLGPAPRALTKAWAVYDMAWAAYCEAVAVCRKAGTAHREAEAAYLETGTIYSKARDAYRKAAAAYHKADTAQCEARAAYRKAVDAHLTPARTARLLARLQRLTPSAPWNGKELVFLAGGRRL